MTPRRRDGGHVSASKWVSKSTLNRLGFLMSTRFLQKGSSKKKKKTFGKSTLVGSNRVAPIAPHFDSSLHPTCILRNLTISEHRSQDACFASSSRKKEKRKKRHIIAKLLNVKYISMSKIFRRHLNNPGAKTH